MSYESFHTPVSSDSVFSVDDISSECLSIDSLPFLDPFDEASLHTEYMLSSFN